MRFLTNQQVNKIFFIHVDNIPKWSVYFVHLKFIKNFFKALYFQKGCCTDWNIKKFYTFMKINNNKLLELLMINQI